MGSYLSDINKSIPLWHYGTILPEAAEKCCLCFLLNSITVELKQMLELCGLININNNIVKFMCSTSGNGGNYSWQIFLLKNSLSDNYFAQMNISKYKVYQNNVWYIGLGYNCSFPINPSTQFKHNKIRKCAELNRLLNEKINKIKSILLINNVLKNNNIKEDDFSNDISFSTNESLPTTTDYSITINFIKNVIIDEDSTIEKNH